MSDFGTQLRQAREGRGISLRQIATSTKISIVALEALERGDFSRLPGGIFSRAFVRAYALEVGLEPDQIVSQFLVELGAAADRVDHTAVHPEVTADDREFLERQRKAALALRIGLVALVVFLLAAFVAWRLSRVGPAASDPVPQSPPSAAAAPAPVDVAPPPAPAAFATNRLTVDIEATDQCWVQVTTDGVVVPARMFSPGERQRFEAQRVMILWVGSAGAIKWAINGRAAKTLGRPGVTRTATITRENASTFLEPKEETSTQTASETGHP